MKGVGEQSGINGMLSDLFNLLDAIIFREFALACIKHVG